MTPGRSNSAGHGPLLLTGPTATGKSELAMLLARQLQGEIISVDSMQVYRGLDIGTAKPSPRDQSEIPHHLIDVVDLEESFDAAKFTLLAKEAVAGIQGRGRVPILCGGTVLYFQAFIGGLGDAPASDPALRTLLERTPLAELLGELEEKDPEFYARVDRRNPRRVIRAVEVIRQTGRPFSALRAEWGGGDASPLFSCRRSAEQLAERIQVRVARMFAEGLVQETRTLLGRGLDRNRTAMQAIGYRQVVEHLQGKRDLEETVALVQLRTRQFAKRQMTWLRKLHGVRWIDLSPDSNLTEVADSVVREYRSLP